MTATALQLTARVIERTPLSQENFRIRLDCPEIARRIIPGQFFMLRVPGRTDPLLGRPFALYDTVCDRTGEPFAIDVGIHVVGKMTGLLEQLPVGACIEIWGPLGNGFPVIETAQLIQVAGGIGYTPFVAVTRELLAAKSYGAPARPQGTATQVDLIYGVRTSALRADLSDWTDLPGLNVQICTDDGSEGYHGLVTAPLTQLLEQAASPPTVLTCGPLRMMQSVAQICQATGVTCYASLETPMACGYGACFSCVVPVKDESSAEGWDYRRSCVEGPVFAGAQIDWTRF